MPTEPARNFFARYVAARRRQILRQPCQKCKTRNEPNAGHSIFAGAVNIDDFAFGKLCVFSYAIQVELQIPHHNRREFRLNADHALRSGGDDAGKQE